MRHCRARTLPRNHLDDSELSGPDERLGQRISIETAAGRQAEGEFDLAEPKLEFEDPVEAGAPDR